MRSPLALAIPVPKAVGFCTDLTSLLSARRVIVVRPALWVPPVLLEPLAPPALLVPLENKETEARR